MRCTTCGAPLVLNDRYRLVCKMPRDFGGALVWLDVHSARERYIQRRRPKRR